MSRLNDYTIVQSVSLFVSTVLLPSQPQTLSFIPSVLAAGTGTEFARASFCLSYICMFTIDLALNVNMCVKNTIIN